MGRSGKARAREAEQREITIVTNFENFPRSWQTAEGFSGASVMARTREQFLACRGPGTIWLVNCNPGLILQLAAAKVLFPRAAELVAVDLVMRAPGSWPGRFWRPIKKILLSRVDHFIHYFRDLRGYERFFGISAARSSYVPFKVNLADRYPLEFTPAGEYVLCLGRSMRDFDTFFEAMEKIPYPAAITKPGPDLGRQHGSRFGRSLERLPGNVRILDDDGSEESMLHIMRDAKIIVLPVLKTSLVASGISTALNAMGLGKCVIGSEGPGMLDVFTGGEVLAVPAENGAALAGIIQQAWEDDALRLRTAEAGFAFASKAGREHDLYQRILARLVDWHVASTNGASPCPVLGRHEPPAREAESLPDK
jgi:glycosyltransferase involved in cell wall biosynthesis